MRRLILLETEGPLPSHFISLAYRTERDKELLSAIATMARKVVADRHLNARRR
jgi:hypothetical protein